MQAAGYIGKNFEESKPLHEIVVAAVQAANESLVGPRRLWVMGGAGADPGWPGCQASSSCCLESHAAGCRLAACVAIPLLYLIRWQIYPARVKQLLPPSPAAAPTPRPTAGTLDLPGRRCMLVEVPGFPFPQYRMHRVNYNFLQRPEHATLDWSFACPGSMVDTPPGTQLPPARVVPDRLPFALPGWAALLPDAALLPAVAAIRGQLVGPSYQEVAAAMVAHLEAGGPLRHRRVGFAAASPS